MVVLLSSAKEADKHLKDNGPTMIVYFAEWCGHCTRMKPVWKELSTKLQGKAKVYMIESENYPKITSFPTAVIVKKGRVVETLNGGGQTVEELTKKLLTIGGNRTRRFLSLGGNRTRRGRSNRLVRRTRKTH
jgi:thiol-disulfide isomerase/thioredoxin